jgi:hypothetical protein
LLTVHKADFASLAKISDADNQLCDTSVMDDEGVAGQFRLKIAAISDTCNRETPQHDPNQTDHAGKTVIIWTRKRDLTRDVYLEESQLGEVRVVKQVTTKDKKVNWRSELDVMGRVRQATEQYALSLIF